MGFAPLADPYPWDGLSGYAARARAHPGGLVNLSIGTPVDPTPAVVRAALADAADSPGYPATHGTPALRAAVVDWFARRRGAPGLDPAAVLPTIGSKELVGLLPALLGLGPGDVVVHPRIAYPTYDVGARLAGAAALATDDVDDWAGRADVRLVWVNSPANPTGRVLGPAELARVVGAARAIGAVVVSDECYAELAWGEPWATSGVPSVLAPAVSGGSPEGLLAAYSLSKQSNLAGYRAAFVAGDPALVARLLATRKHLGMIVPRPVQAAMTAALGDDAHVAEQRATYGRRREVLLAAVRTAGFRVDHSEAGLYLWVRAGGDGGCWDLIGWFAERGILAGPGVFYGPAAGGHVRLALTASDERIEAAAARITAGQRARP